MGIPVVPINIEESRAIQKALEKIVEQCTDFTALKFASDLKQVNIDPDLTLFSNGDLVKYVDERDRSLPAKIFAVEYLHILGSSYDIDLKEAIKLIEGWRDPIFQKDLADMEDQSHREIFRGYFVRAAASMIRSKLLSPDLSELKQYAINGEIFSYEDKLYAEMELDFARNCDLVFYFGMLRDMKEVGFTNDFCSIEAQKAISMIDTLRATNQYQKLALHYNNLSKLDLIKINHLVVYNV